VSLGNTVLGWLVPPYVALLKLSLIVRPYRYDSRNPARRWCRRCGQREELHGVYDADPLDGGRFRATGWEVMYPIAMEPCKKHETGSPHSR